MPLMKAYHICSLSLPRFISTHQWIQAFCTFTVSFFLFGCLFLDFFLYQYNYLPSTPIGYYIKLSDVTKLVPSLGLQRKKKQHMRGTNAVLSHFSLLHCCVFARKDAQWDCRTGMGCIFYGLSFSSLHFRVQTLTVAEVQSRRHSPPPSALQDSVTTPFSFAQMRHCVTNFLRSVFAQVSIIRNLQDLFGRYYATAFASRF